MRYVLTTWNYFGVPRIKQCETLYGAEFMGINACKELECRRYQIYDALFDKTISDETYIKGNKPRFTKTINSYIRGE